MKTLKNLWKIALTSLFALTITACNPIGGRIIDKLPLSVIYPADFQIRLDTSGGMLPTGSTIYISKNQSYKEESKRVDGDYRTIFTPFQVTDEELSALYQNIILDNKVADIKTHEEDVYDRGGIALNVNFGKTHYFKADSGRNYIETSSYPQFHNIELAINALADGKTKDKTATIEMTFKRPTSLIDATILLDGNKMGTYWDYQAPNLVKITPGSHKLEMPWQILVNEPKPHFENIYKDFNFNTLFTKKIDLSLDGKNIVVKS